MGDTGDDSQNPRNGRTLALFVLQELMEWKIGLHCGAIERLWRWLPEPHLGKGSKLSGECVRSCGTGLLYQYELVKAKFNFHNLVSPPAHASFMHLSSNCVAAHPGHPLSQWDLVSLLMAQCRVFCDNKTKWTKTWRVLRGSSQKDQQVLHKPSLGCRSGKGGLRQDFHSHGETAVHANSGNPTESMWEVCSSWDAI